MRFECGERMATPGCYVLLSENRDKIYGLGSHTVMYVGETDNFFVRIEDHIGGKYFERCNQAEREVDYILFAGCHNDVLRDVALRECRI